MLRTIGITHFNFWKSRSFINNFKISYQIHYYNSNYKRFYSTFKTDSQKLNSNYNTLPTYTQKPLSNMRKPSTINPLEIARFKEISSEIWDLDGPFSLLHLYNPIRIQFIKDTLYSYAKNYSFTKDNNFRSNDKETHTTDLSFNNSYTFLHNWDSHSSIDSFQHNPYEKVDSPFPFSSYKILDVGCGGGILSEALARLGGDVEGIDAATDMITVAKMHWDEEKKSYHKNSFGNINYRFTSLECIVDLGEKYDIVIASEVIEHVDNPEYFFKLLSKCLKENGKLVITTINRTIDSYLLAIVFAQNILHWVPKDVHSWDNFVSPEDLKQFSSKTNMFPLKKQGVSYLPIFKKFIHEPFARVMYMMSFQKLANEHSQA